jgi:hypothetical protein
VNVRKSGYEVRARSGYYAPTVGDMTRARESALAAELPEDVERALGDLTNAGRPDRPIDLWVGMARGAGGQTRVTVAWTPRQEAQHKIAAGASLTVSATNAFGESYFEGTSVSSEPLVFEAPPGEAVLKITTRDKAGDELDTETRRLEVLNFAGDGVALGSPVLLRARTPQEARGLLAGGPGSAWAGRQFERTDRVFIRFAVYGADAPEPTAQLLNRQAKVLVALPVARLENGERQLDLPLTSIARGDYLVSIEAKRDDVPLTAVVPLRIR